MKQRAKNDINIPLIGKLLKGSVIDNTSTNPDKIIFTDKAGFVTAIPSKDYAANFENVDAKTTVNVMLQKNAVVENVEGGITKFAKGIQMGSAIGTLAGLGFGYYRKSSVGGYIGYAIGFGILGAIVGGYISGRSAVSSLKDTVGGTTTSGTGTESGNKTETKTDTSKSSNNPTQADEIIKSMSSMILPPVTESEKASAKNDLLNMPSVDFNMIYNYSKFVNDPAMKSPNITEQQVETIAKKYSLSKTSIQSLWKKLETNKNSGKGVSLYKILSGG